MRTIHLSIILGLGIFILPRCSNDSPTPEEKLFTGNQPCNGGATAPILPAFLYVSSEVPDPCMMQWARKGYYLNKYVPSEKIKEFVTQKLGLLKKNAPYTYVTVSAYRSYDDQVNTFYKKWVPHCRASHPKASQAELENCAWQFSAKPGTSEHQLGTVFDLGTPGLATFNIDGIGSPFGKSAAGRWLRENAHRFGFTMSYPWGEEALHCYDPEPWHWRYVGVSLATQFFARAKQQNQPFSTEHFFREMLGVIPPVPSIGCPATRADYNYNETAATTGSSADTHANTQCKSAWKHWTTCISASQACINGQIVACTGKCEANSVIGTHDKCLSSLCSPSWGNWTTCVLQDKAACQSGAIRGCAGSCKATGVIGTHDHCSNI